MTAPAEMPGVEERIAAYLKLRDEMVTDPDERTDEERSESAKELAALFAPILAEKEALRLDNDRLQTKACAAVDHARAVEAQAAEVEVAWSVLGLPERRGYLGNEIMSLQDSLKNALVSSHKSESRALAAEAALAAERAQNEAYRQNRHYVMGFNAGFEEACEQGRGQAVIRAGE